MSRTLLMEPEKCPRPECFTYFSAFERFGTQDLKRMKQATSCPKCKLRLRFRRLGQTWTWEPWDGPRIGG